MNATDFELNVSLPADSRFAAAMRDLAAHAARYGGCGDADADRFGAAVETVVRACVDRAGSGAVLPVIIRRSAGPVEFLVGCQGWFETAAHEGPVTISWTREQGPPMCRVGIDV